MKTLNKIGKEMNLFLSIVIITESIYLAYLIYNYGYINKVFVILFFMVIAKLGQIQNILMYGE